MARQARPASCAEKYLTLTFPDIAPQEQGFTTADNHRIRILSMNSALADRTWVVKIPPKGGTPTTAGIPPTMGTWCPGETTNAVDGYVICGPAFVGDVHIADGKVSSLTIERPYGQPSCGKVIVYGEKVQHLAVTSDATLDSAPAPQLGNWQMRLAPGGGCRL